MKLYNALTAEINELEYKNNCVRMYACGPTVYNYVHIGNARPIVTVDLLIRCLKMQNIEVKYLQNYTDVDDKIIKEAIRKNTTEKIISEFFIQAFEQDIKNLNVIAPTRTARISDYMEEQILFIQQLINQGDAYEAGGNVFFRINNFVNREKLAYGELSKRNLEELNAGERVEINELKENPLDFVLWKKTTEGITWHSLFGEGRPGWHTECAVLNDVFFEHQTIDLHAGGIDLKFPHHENERIQYIATNHRELANMWIYNGHINMDNQKMSKSLGNIILLKDFISKHSANALKYMFYNTSYRQPLNITDQVINQAKNEVEKLYNLAKKLNIYKALHPAQPLIYKEFTYVPRVIEYLNDDLNSPNALMVLSELTKVLNQQARVNDLDFHLIQEFDCITNAIFGLVFNLPVINEQHLELLRRWERAKLEQNFSLADELRKTLENNNIL